MIEVVSYRMAAVLEHRNRNACCVVQMRVCKKRNRGSDVECVNGSKSFFLVLGHNNSNVCGRLSFVDSLQCRGCMQNEGALQTVLALSCRRALLQTLP